MLDDRIKPVDDGGDHLLVPDEKAAISGALIEHKAQADIVALALDTIDPASAAFEAHPAGFAHTDTIDRLIGTGGEGLGHCTIDVVSNPADAGAFGVLMQFIFRKVMLLAQLRKRLRSFLPFRARDGTCPAPCGIGVHLTEARIAFRKQSIVQTPSGLQVSTQAALLAPIHAQGQFDEKGWGLRSLHGLLCLSRDVLMIPELNTKE